MQIKFISSTSNQPSSLLRKVAMLISGIVLVTVALMFSAVLLAGILIVAVFGGAFLWWKTRELRKMMRNFTPPPASMRGDTFAGGAPKGEVFEGEVFEGEVVQVDVPQAREKR